MLLHERHAMSSTSKEIAAFSRGLNGDYYELATNMNEHAIMPILWTEMAGLPRLSCCRNLADGSGIIGRQL
jgi:hypothetical protein